MFFFVLFFVVVVVGGCYLRQIKDDEVCFRTGFPTHSSPHLLLVEPIGSLAIDSCYPRILFLSPSKATLRSVSKKGEKKNNTLYAGKETIHFLNVLYVQRRE